jgi:ABC-type lipoprotein export system ATPase subunit
MGFYMQGGELISTLTLRENVAMPLRLNGVSSWQAYERADYLLSFLLGPNSKSQRNKLANECSGGEAQRVAIARSLAHQPKILFIDEPTSNLDAQNKRRVLDLMVSLVRSENVTVVNISHDQELAIEYSNFMLRLTADPVGWGKLIDHEFRPTEDGFGKPASYAAKIDGHWVPTDAAFQPFVTNQLDFEGDNQNAA